MTTTTRTTSAAQTRGSRATSAADGGAARRARRDYVARPRLRALLNRGAAGPLTLISAPPGAGKTVLLSEWARDVRGGKRVAWLTLTPDHAAPSAFWGAVLTEVVKALGKGTVPKDADARELRRVAADLDGPLYVVIDDFHEVRARGLLESIAQLASDPPHRLRLVIATRRDPDIGLPRLRLSGALTEIRGRDLAFTHEEARALLGDIRLQPEHVAAIVSRTEGWAAALRFAALSLRARPDAADFIAALAHTDRAVVDYLASEVLERQPDERREFLLKASICGRINSSLADAMTGRRDGERALQELERENLFVEIEPDGVWYRFHPLFVELLRAEARFELGDELTRAHARAAEWCAANGLALEALRHAVAAKDSELTGRLVGALWLELWTRGEATLASAFLDEIPADALRSRPELALLAAWLRLDSGETAEYEAWRSVAEAAAASLDGPELTDFTLARDVLAATRCRREGDLDGLDVALERLNRPDAVLQHPGSDEPRRALVLCNRGAAALWRGEITAAISLLEQALVAAQRSSLSSCRLDATSLLAFAWAAHGDLRRAARLASAAAEEAAAPKPSPAAIPGLLALALCYYEWDDVERGDAYAYAARDISDRVGDRAGRMAAIAIAARGDARRDGASLEDARVALAGLGDAAHEPPLLAPYLDLLRSRIALVDGDRAAARAALAARGVGDAERLVGLARIALGDDDAAQAGALLEGVFDGTAAPSFATARIEAAVLRAVAASQSGTWEEVLPWIERALELAERETIRGPFVEAGPVVAEPLRIAIRRGTAHRWLAGSLLEVIDGRSTQPGAAPRELLDPLSDKEQVVLRYLPTLMSNQEIAGELFVSVNTVKTHLKSIYRKLGATQRREAVRRAHELRLIGY